MLNTEITDRGIVVTDKAGQEVGLIERDIENGCWTAQAFNWIHKFKRLDAAEYYVLAIWMEEQDQG